MKITFMGAAQEVTGSSYMLESGSTKILIDCGLHQGGHYAEKENFEKFNFDASEIGLVVVTHAHLDHTGRLPKLYMEGFRGKVISTAPTKDLAELVLLDSEHILGKEAEREGIENFCTLENTEGTMKLWEEVPYHEKYSFGPFEIEFYDAGHILGSAIAKISAEGKTIVFSGDLGNYPAPIVAPTEVPLGADFCVIESTYGDRIHEERDQRVQLLKKSIRETVSRGGTLIIPAFALERTQELLYHLHDLFEKGEIPRVPVFIDSPLAIKMTEVYRKYEKYFNKETYEIVKSGDDIMNFPGLHLTLTTEQSKEINDYKGPKIVIAGSGMSNGGRILHHEARYLPDPKSTILIVGYQSEGTLGRQIMDGADEVRIFGQMVPVRCHRQAIHGYSAHADQPRLLDWLARMNKTVKKVFVTHGELESANVLAQKIMSGMDAEAIVPTRGTELNLELAAASAAK